jgi:hypothetical protein
MNRKIVLIIAIIAVVVISVFSVMMYSGSQSYYYQSPESTDGVPEAVEDPYSDIPDHFRMYFNLEPNYLTFRFHNYRGADSELHLTKISVNGVVVKEALASQEWIKFEPSAWAMGEVSLDSTRIGLDTDDFHLLEKCYNSSELTLQVELVNGVYEWKVTPPYNEPELMSTDAYIKP